MTCAMTGCDRVVLARGLCARDYQRWRKHGDPTYVPPNLGNRTARVLPERRTCTDCGFEGARDQFPKARNVCRPCRTKRQAAWATANPEKVAASRARLIANGSTARSELRRRTRILAVELKVVADYRDSHSGRCDICGGVSAAGRDLSIDHCHASGAFRGLLCDNCNRGIGLFADQPDRLLAAAAYLIRSRAEGVTPGDLYRLILAQRKAGT